MAYIICNGTFNIHGLWPEYDSNHWPAFCHKEPFSLDGLDLKRMNQRWTTCKNTTVDNYYFWKHEWEKHSTCSPFNKTEYFTTVLNLDEWLVRKGAVKKMVHINLNFTLQKFSKIQIEKNIPKNKK